MDKIILEEKYVLEYIKDTLKIRSTVVNNAQYHHNTSYSNASSIIRSGILSMQDMNKLHIKTYSEEILTLMSDTDSHINGNDHVSLSIAGLDNLYRGEEEYNPFNPNEVDFLVSNSISAFRSSVHYGNEFLVRQGIPTDKLKSLDIRLISLINNYINFSFPNNKKIQNIII